MTYPGSENDAPGRQPATPAGAWTPPQGTAEEAPQQQSEKTGADKWLPVAGSVHQTVPGSLSTAPVQSTYSVFSKEAQRLSSAMNSS